jgi:hypothetical protein
MGERGKKVEPGGLPLILDMQLRSRQTHARPFAESLDVGKDVIPFIRVQPSFRDDGKRQEMCERHAIEGERSVSRQRETLAQQEHGPVLRRACRPICWTDGQCPGMGTDWDPSREGKLQPTRRAHRSGVRINLGVPHCSHPVARPWLDEMRGDGSGQQSQKVCRVRTLRLWRFCQRSRHDPCSIVPGVGIGPWRGRPDRWNALGAARRPFRNEASAPPTVTAGFAVARAANSSTSGVLAL